MNPNEKYDISLIMQKILFLYKDQWKTVHCFHLLDAHCAE